MIVRIDYTNWKGERRIRRISPIVGGLRFHATQFHPELQWLLDAIDMDINEIRTFAMKSIHSWVPEETI